MLELWRTLHCCLQTLQMRSMQVYASLQGPAIGEYFRDTGRPALIFMMILSKQAVAIVRYHYC